MLSVRGVFKCIEIKDVKGKKILSLSNSDKDRDGNYKNTYYVIWVNEKVSKMVNDDLKRKMKNKAILDIKGFLRVSKKDKYTNLYIYPTEIKEYKKNN
jgi:hypothetical protein